MIGATEADTKLEVIGTASGRILHAQDSLRSSGSLIVQTTGLFKGNLTSRGTLSGAALTVMGGTSYLMGNVGIGTTDTSLAKFSVLDNTTLTSYFGSTNASRARIGVDAFTAGADSMISFMSEGASKWSIGPRYSNSYALSFAPSYQLNSPVMTMLTTGNVGIGTTSPSEKLEILGTASGRILHAQDSLTSSGTLVWEGSASGASLWVSSLQGANLTDCDNGTNSKLLWDATTGRFSCGTDQGGASSPTAGQGLSLSLSNVFSLNSAFSGTALEIMGTASGRILHAQDELRSSGSLIVQTTGLFKGNLTSRGTLSGAALTVMGGTSYLMGNVGIGTTSPANPNAGGNVIQMQGTTYPMLRLTSTTANGGDVRLESSAGAYEMYLQDNDLRFWDDTADRVTFANGGNVGIGTTSPGEKLEILGTASGRILHAQDSLTSSGTLVWETSASGASLWVSSFEGAGLTDCDASTSKVIWDDALNKFSCGTDLNTGSSTAGQGITVNSGVISLSTTFSGTSLEILGTSSGRILHAQDELRSSGTLVIEGASTFGGALTIAQGALTDSSIVSADINDGTITTSDLGTDSVSADELNATGVEAELEAVLDHNDLQGYIANEHINHTAVLMIAGQGITGGGDIAANRSFSLSSIFSGTSLEILGTASGRILHAQDSLTSSGTLVWETSASGASLWVSSFEGAGLTDCDASTSKVIWDDALNKFSCGTDLNTGSSTAGQGITVNSGVISLSSSFSGTALEIIGTSSGRILHAQDELRSSGSLVVEGTTTLGG
ncbi:MAG: hypothetical protein AAB544_00330, partial [Patescibacteria group bacterium]